MKTHTLDDLLIKPVPVDIEGFGDKPLRFYIRRLTQVERDLCTASARRASREMRKKLEDTSTEEHMLLIEDEIAEIDMAALRAAWVSARVTRKSLTIYRLSLENRDQTFIPEPEGDDVLPADVERWENAVEDAEEDREKAVREAIASAQRELNEAAEKLTLEELRDGAGPALIDNICADIWTTEYVAQMIARGTFTDKDTQKPAFKTATEVKRLQPKALELLSKSHMGLLIEPEAVKNSLGAQK